MPGAELFRRVGVAALAAGAGAIAFAIARAGPELALIGESAALALLAARLRLGTRRLPVCWIARAIRSAPSAFCSPRPGSRG